MKLYSFLVIVQFLFSISLVAKSSNSPNIIFILADDLGYMDVNYFAEKLTGNSPDSMFYETPNIDLLAKNGVAFTQAYANQLCSPTRASLLTGKFASRLGFTTATPNTYTYYSKNIEVPESYHPLDAVNHRDNISVESPLKNGTTLTALPSGQELENGLDEITIAEALKGYRSAFLGKWHIGGHGAKGFQPSNQGFEELAYCDAGGSPYYKWRGKWSREIPFFEEMPQEKLYIGKAGDETGENYLTDDLTVRAMDFIEENKNSEKPFFLYFCHFAVHSPWQGKKELNPYFEAKETKGWNNHANVNYASMLKALDNSVGSLINKLNELDMDDETIILFMSDNGGLTYNKKWGEITSNEPLKGGKACLTEGGVRVPLIICDPRISSSKNDCGTIVNCTDIFPTIVDLAGFNVKSYYHKIDGRSLAPLLKDVKNKKQEFKEKSIYWHYPYNVVVKNPDDGYPLTPHSAIRKGDFKLIVDWAGNLKLYNITEDISEENNLVESMPEKKDELFSELVNYLKENVESRYWPLPNPNYIETNDPREYNHTNLRKLLINPNR